MPEVIVRKGEPVDRALKRLKNKLDAEGILEEVRRLRAFETPNQKSRRKAGEPKRGGQSSASILLKKRFQPRVFRAFAGRHPFVFRITRFFIKNNEKSFAGMLDTCEFGLARRLLAEFQLPPDTRFAPGRSVRIHFGHATVSLEIIQAPFPDVSRQSSIKRARAKQNAPKAAPYPRRYRDRSMQAVLRQQWPGAAMLVVPPRYLRPSVPGCIFHSASVGRRYFLRSRVDNQVQSSSPPSG
jgi:small subunit ribosomal protein S21